MFIKMKTSSAGPDGVRPVGWEGEVPDKEGRELVAGEFAVAIKPRSETATKKPATQKATKPTGEKRVKK